VKDAFVPDFHSVRQALNVASADQRVLVLVHGSDEQLKTLRTTLRPVANDARIIGRFHFDFEESSEWKKTVTGTNGEPGINVIRASEFGLDGSIMQKLPLDAAAEDVIRVLIKANSEFARTTEKKVYSSHVNKGNRLGVYFEGAVPYGEDRDGDGQIDNRGRGPIRVSPRGGRPSSN
jgi:mRNA degradation ribonuclease J1/J2